MANKAQISWVEYEIPAASATTFSKDGGMQSSGSLGGNEAKQVARSGGITSPGSLGGDESRQIARGGGISSAASLGGSKGVGIPKDGGISTEGSLGGPSDILATYDKFGGIISSGDPDSSGPPSIVYISKAGGFETGTAAVGPGVLPPPSGIMGGGNLRTTRRTSGRVVKPVSRVSRAKKLTKKQRIEKSAESILKRKELPEYFSLGAQKAYKRMQEFYGSLEGRKIFIKKALEQGSGDTLVEIVNDVYKTGAKVDTSTKIKTQVRMTRSGPDVKILSKFK